MSSFQFPANPSDGDIVVRGNLQAFYNAATNTWRVSEVPTAPGIPGPPGPPGPIGPPGQGVQISGAVATEADLPAPNAAQFEFWIVDDTNELYWSDGLTWTNFGGPIQGPQGDEGEKGEDGTNGQNGRGWYDTSVDESNGEYKVTFLSNDGLTFTTDNLKGPAGNDGNDGQDFNGTFPIATENSPGVVQIGDGIAVDSSGVIEVDLDTVPLDSVDGETFNINYDPKFFTFNNGSLYSGNFVGNQTSTGPITGWNSSSVTYTPPTNASQSLVFFFSSSEQYLADGVNPGTGVVTTPKAYVGFQISSDKGTFLGNGQEQFSVGIYHNLVFVYNSSNYTVMRQLINTTKFDVLNHGANAGQMTLTTRIHLVRAQHSKLNVGAGRMIIIPIRGSSTNTATNPFASVWAADDANQMAGEFNTPDYTSLFNDDDASNISHYIDFNLSKLDQAMITHSGDTAVTDQLTALRQQYNDLYQLSGDAEDVYYALSALNAQLDTLIERKFPFQ